MGIKVAFQEVSADDTEPSTVQSLIPEAAVRSEDGQRIVFVVADGVVERRAVAVGGQSGTEIEVLAGVMPGERVVVGGPEELRDGQSVRITG
jgi:multidrug efflux pump subunit AcrA (membrane-fusion protein)